MSQASRVVIIAAILELTMYMIMAVYDRQDARFHPHTLIIVFSYNSTKIPLRYNYGSGHTLSHFAPNWGSNRLKNGNMLVVVRSKPCWHIVFISIFLVTVSLFTIMYVFFLLHRFICITYFFDMGEYGASF